MNSRVSLAELALVDLDREAFVRILLDDLLAIFGPDAGIALDDPAWDLDTPGPRDAVRVAIGDVGTLRLPRDCGDGEAFAQSVLACVRDFEAIDRAERRAARLESLYRAAQTFTAELDLDRVLSMIVNWGRDLTGNDICYLSLNDLDRGITYIRSTAGTYTPEFGRVQLRYGEGLGGLVAKEGRPYYSRDYLHDDRFVHVVDGQVSGEGVVSVAGVPVRLVDRAIGVLFIANRRVSDFDEEDIAFLQALADYAAVAIENARLYGLLDQAARLHRRLTDIVLSEQPEQALEAAISKAVGLQVEIRRTAEEEDGGAALITPVRAGPTVLGHLVVDTAHATDGQRTALEQAARVVAVHLLKERAVAQAALRSRGELLDAIVSGAVEPEELHRRAELFGVDVTKPHRALVFAGDRAEEVAPRLPGSFLAGRLGNTIALVRPESEIPPLGLVAVGSVGAGVDGIARSIVEASRILEVSQLLDRADGVTTSSDLGVFALLLDAQRTDDLVSQARSLLSPILAYDGEHGQTLLPTLEAVLDAQGSPTEAARKLHVHVNSVYYRLQRIRDLGAFDLDDPDARLQLHVACRLIRFGRRRS